MNVVVVIGGGPLGSGDAGLVPPGALIVAADSGVDHALAAGLIPDVVVGDFDSISPAGAEWVERSGVAVERHPPNKNATDTELAVALAATRSTGNLLVLGGDGTATASTLAATAATATASTTATDERRRLDHLLATFGCLGSPLTARFQRVEARIGTTTVAVATPDRPVTLDLAAGTLFSVLALHGACHGVSLTGAEWPLDDADLAAGSGHGISNIARQVVTVSVTTGTITVVIP